MDKPKDTDNRKSKRQVNKDLEKQKSSNSNEDQNPPQRNIEGENITQNETGEVNQKVPAITDADKDAKPVAEAESEEMTTADQVIPVDSPIIGSEFEEEKDADIDPESHRKLQTLEKLYEQYHAKILYWHEQGGTKDLKNFEAARKQFNYWKKFLLCLCDNYDDLYFELSQIIERDEFNVIRDKRILSLPLDPRDPKENISTINRFSEEVKSLTEHSLEDFLKLRNINIRTSSDLDYRLQDDDIPIDIRAFHKNALNTVLLILKEFSKTLDKLRQLLARMLKQESTVFAPIEKINSQQILDYLFDNKISDNEREEKIISELIKVEELLQKNYQTATNALELARDLKEKYFDLLQKTIIKVINSLMEGKKNYEKNIETKEVEKLRRWGGIYDLLSKLLLSYLKEKQKIEPIPCEPGDEFNPELHKPYLEAEPDDELPENAIKEVVNMGFQFNDGEILEVIKEVDVIVVSK